MLTALLGCQSKAYLNMNARYNGYYYADTYLKEVYQQLEDNYQYNFNDVLDILPKIDSSTISSNKEKLDDAFKKSSEIIEVWKNSDWVDDAYLIIGKIRHLRAQFQFAIETFQYINVNSKDDDTRHAALIALMRTYIDMRSLDLANEVSNVIEYDEELNDANKLEYRVTKAYLRQIEENEEGVLSALTGINELIRNKDQRFRTNFILGQLSQKNGQKAKAYEYFNLVTKGTPPYELLFHARLNKMALTDYNSQVSLDKAYKSFNKMLDDGKNLEYQDIIYYTMGEVEQSRSNFRGAIENYSLATQVPQPNQRQQGLAFLRMGEIFYDNFEDFKRSSLYYDSAVIKLPPTEKGIETIKKRQELLKDFVTQLDIIALNDSLMSLSQMNPVSLDAFLDRFLDDKAAKQLAADKEKKKNKVVVQTNINADVTNDDSWYFYNAAALNQGQIEFQRQWGNRPLEDNWRRSSKNTVAIGVDRNSLTKDLKQKRKSKETVEDTRESEKSELRATIPFSEEQKQKLQLEMEDAYFELGSIYRFGFQNADQSIESYKTLLNRFGDTKHRLDAIYALYIMYLDKDVSISNNYKEQITREFPETLTAKLLLNPRYLEEKAERTKRLESRYAQAYAFYESGDFLQADQITRDILNTFEDVDFLPTVELLSAILKSKTESIVSYEQVLNQYIKKYEDNQLTAFARELKEAINPQKQQVVTSLGSAYSEDFQQIHLVMILFNAELNDKNELKEEVEKFNAANFSSLFLNVGEISFDQSSKLEVLFINPIKTKTAAEIYNDELEKALNKLQLNADAIFNTFEISKDNFTKLFGTKNLEEYLDFNRKFYK